MRSRYGNVLGGSRCTHTQSFHNSSVESSKARSEYGVEDVDEIERLSQYNPDEADSDEEKTVAVLK